MLGMVLNGGAILVVRYNPTLRSSFGLLCLSHTIANMGSLLIVVFWIAPITLLKSSVSTEILGKLLSMANTTLCSSPLLVPPSHKVQSSHLPLFPAYSIIGKYYVVKDYKNDKFTRIKDSLMK
ncbi:hypothetical protein KIN20_035040 [Parelaphostrongylus tenuis]|uniref:7TM GPCR serpentine receptor class x (Srx) domain-containing protein n=1 Tax=Parelaphostrongylus tenuis TaxID=148309 RepID=A0AAD5WJE4_PARTN|nr:hypothetical protein KIN20_035040 [Parelaphostrongylus tenuis]